MKTVAELIKELSVLDQSKPIWIHYDMAYSQTPEISIADADTYDCDNRIKVGDYLLLTLIRYGIPRRNNHLPQVWQGAGCEG